MLFIPLRLFYEFLLLDSQTAQFIKDGDIQKQLNALQINTLQQKTTINYKNISDILSQGLMLFQTTQFLIR